jgi:hypothetical protein
VGRFLGAAALVDGASQIPGDSFLSPVHGRRRIHAHSLCLPRPKTTRDPFVYVSTRSVTLALNPLSRSLTVIVWSPGVSKVNAPLMVCLPWSSAVKV